VASYIYRAVDGCGSHVNGTIESSTVAGLTQLLESQGLVVIDVSTGGGATPQANEKGVCRTSRAAVVDITRALAGLLSAGLPLSRALGAAASVTHGPVIERLSAIRERVSRGETLSSALGSHPDMFSPLYVGLVRAGERSGDLDSTFTRLASQLEREDELRSKLISAAIYPVLLGIVGSVAVLTLLLFVLPRFADVLQGAGARLLRSTAMLLNASTVAQHYWFMFLLPPIAVIATVGWVRTSDAGSRAWSSTLLALPLIGRLRRDVLAARFARMASVLLAGGAPVLSALDDAAASMPDLLARDDIIRVRARVREGASMHGAVSDSMLFPPLLSQLVALGEETGRLEEFLRKAAELFEQRSERMMTRVVALAEPAMIIVLGVVVGSVALSLLQAIYGVNAGSFQ
jgi:type II secretory pathway component PulF